MKQSALRPSAPALHLAHVGLVTRDCVRTYVQYVRTYVRRCFSGAPATIGTHGSDPSKPTSSHELSVRARCPSWPPRAVLAGRLYVRTCPGSRFIRTHATFCRRCCDISGNLYDCLCTSRTDTGDHTEPEQIASACPCKRRILIHPHRLSHDVASSAESPHRLIHDAASSA